MSHFSKILKWLVNILSVFLLLVLALVLYGRATVIFSNNKYPNYFGYTFFSVASGSMEPTLHINDVILVKITKENLKKNDIITYKKNNEIITHRVVYIDNNIITVKGDNNNTIDSPITNDVVIGKVIKIFPKLSIWQKILTEPKILIAIFITLILFDFAISYKGKETVEKLNNNKSNENDSNKNKKIIPEPKIINNQDKLKQEELLEMTRAINLDEIEKVLTDDIEEKKVIKRKVRKVKDKTEELNKKRAKEQDYTVRLDLNEIQKNIRKKIR